MKEAGYEWDAEKKELKKIEQKPTEWSEEDDLIRTEAIYFINEFQKSDRCVNENDMRNSVTCENWLKSLKPNHWKPSYEEIKALESLTVYAPYSNQVEILNHLLDELKNL